MATGLGTFVDISAALLPPLVENQKVVFDVDDLITSIIRHCRPLEIRGEWARVGPARRSLGPCLRPVLFSESRLFLV